MSTAPIALHERIIFALDVATPELAKAHVERLESHIHFFKVGLQLFLAGGFPMVDWITARGHKVFLDLKFYDVPQTVKLAVSQLKDRNIALTTLHGNSSIMRAAVEAQSGVSLLAVTVLTSFGPEDLEEMGTTCTIEDLVLARAKQAVELGCAGVVASGHEAVRMRQKLGNDFCIVTPGIRPATHAGGDDQKRVMTAGQAIENGADYVVVGRPISQAQKPLEVVAAMQQEIMQAVETRISR